MNFDLLVNKISEKLENRDIYMVSTSKDNKYFTKKETAIKYVIRYIKKYIPPNLVQFRYSDYGNIMIKKQYKYWYFFTKYNILGNNDDVDTKIFKECQEVYFDYVIKKIMPKLLLMDSNKCIDFGRSDDYIYIKKIDVIRD